MKKIPTRKQRRRQQELWRRGACRLQVGTLPPFVKRYRHRQGFNDNTDYLGLAKDGNVYFVLKSGWCYRSLGYTAAICEHLVTEGEWTLVGAGVELPAPYPNRARYPNVPPYPSYPPIV